VDTKTPPRLSPAPRVWLDGPETEKALIDARATKGEAARAMGVHPSMISKYLSGQRDLSRDQAVVLAHFLDVPLDRIAVDRAACPHCHGSLVAA
jgi:transcriptional regulator with XRE-family HTH domain